MILNINSTVRFYKKVSRLINFKELKTQHDMTKVNILSASSDSVKLAVELLKKGEVIAIPTDTVYGLAADSRNGNAIQLLYDIKGRDFEKPIAICVGNVEDIAVWGDVSDLPPNLLDSLLPGPVTVILNRTNATSLKLNPGVKKVGVRVPDSSFIRDIAINFGSAIALTSANRSNYSSTLDPNEFSELWPKLGAVFDGGTLSFSDASRAGSTIVDLTVPDKYKIVRSGCALSNTLSVLKLFSFKEEK